MPTYTHVGYRAATGHYAVTADAIRTPGKDHALIAVDRGSYRSLCGVAVSAESADHFVDGNPIRPAFGDPAAEVECVRCRKALGLGPRYKVLFLWGTIWAVLKGHGEHASRKAALEAAAEFRGKHPGTAVKVKAW
jgi:hypothetical protein